MVQILFWLMLLTINLEAVVIWSFPKVEKGHRISYYRDNYRGAPKTIGYILIERIAQSGFDCFQVELSSGVTTHYSKLYSRDSAIEAVRWAQSYDSSIPNFSNLIYRHF